MKHICSSLTVLLLVVACSSAPKPRALVEHTQYGISVQLINCKYEGSPKSVFCNYSIENKNVKPALFTVWGGDFRVANPFLERGTYFDIPAEKLNGKELLKSVTQLELSSGEKFNVNAQFDIGEYDKKYFSSIPKMEIQFSTGEPTEIFYFKILETPIER